MLFKENKKELIICILSLAILVLAITTNVFATTPDDLASLLQNGNKQQINYIPSNTTTNNTTSNTTNNTVNTTTNNTISNTTNSTVSNTTNNTVNNTRNNIVNNTTPTTHPDAGLDQSVLLIIAICGISTIYAYKKIRDYKI